MKINDTLPGKMIIAVFLAGVTYILLYLSLGWSWQATIEYIFDAWHDKGFAWALGGLIQFSPQVFLTARTHTLRAIDQVNGTAAQKRKKVKELKNRAIFWLVMFWALTLFDTYTNWGAYYIQLGSWDAMWATGMAGKTVLVLAVGFGITFCEEFLALIVSLFFHKIAEIIEEMGGEPPNVLYLAAERARSATF